MLYHHKQLIITNGHIENQTTQITLNFTLQHSFIANKYSYLILEHFQLYYFVAQVEIENEQQKLTKNQIEICKEDKRRNNKNYRNFKKLNRNKKSQLLIIMEKRSNWRKKYIFQIDNKQLFKQIQKNEFSVKVADLGNAYWTHHQFSTLIQIQEYLSSKVLIGSRYNTTTDIWSFAFMFFDLLTGDFLLNQKKDYIFGK